MQAESASKRGMEEEPLGATRERVLDVAERLFAERGLDAVSIRDITGEAGANLGAINYHFGTKEKLIGAVFERGISSVSQQRLLALEAVEKAAGDKPPTLEAILEAMFRPAVERAMDPKRGGNTFGMLMARSFVEPNPAVENVIHSHFEPVVKRFDAALRRLMPELGAEGVFWRMHLLLGALHQSLLLLHRQLPGMRSLRMDAETYINRFVAFAAAAFRAPLPGESRKRPSK
ncbi:MAG: CerR family C-terminal domain-containing protein [Candidatus Omnitrophica bacterium]|nr:CerR family C-terminal domain-containing protein [Candidatus Omnitrophota bacterium]